MNGCHEHGDVDVFYPEHFDVCPLCKAEEDRKEAGIKYRAERTKARHLAHALRAVPGPKRMSFPYLDWEGSQKYEKWYEGTRAEALAEAEVAKHPTARGHTTCETLPCAHCKALIEVEGGESCTTTPV